MIYYRDASETFSIEFGDDLVLSVPQQIHRVMNALKIHEEKLLKLPPNPEDCTRQVPRKKENIVSIISRQADDRSHDSLMRDVAT